MSESPCCYRDARNSRAHPYLHLALIGALLLAAGTLGAAAWDKLDPADLASTESDWSPGADAEMLIDRQVVIAGVYGATFERYQRTKIYTQKGVEDAGKLAFEYPGTAMISRLEARVVKPDGRSIELEKSDFFVSDVARRLRKKWKKTSMVFPDLQPGDIVECRWRESIPDGLVNTWDYCQRAIPVRHYSISLDAEGYVGLIISWYNTPSAKTQKVNGRATVVATHLPPFEDEDLALPKRDLCGWVWINYGDSVKDSAKWKEINEDREQFFRDSIKRHATIEKKVAELIAGATTDEQKLERLFEFCRRSITNYSYYESADIQKSVKKRENRGDDFQTARRTLERGGGYSHEIDYLFASMAQAAGYKVRQVISAGRDDIVRTNVFRGWGLLDRVTIGVKVGESWQHYSPGDHLLPFGLLAWEIESAFGVVTAKGEVKGARLPASDASVSSSRRVGRFTLDTEGTLEGTVEETLTGHEAVAIKRTCWPLNREECRTEIEKSVTDRLPSAEVSEISWEHINDLEYPVIIRYRLRVPAYAEEVGERLMIIPSVFEHGSRPLFSAETRSHPIMLPYSFSEHDDIHITLPEGYALDQPSAPSPVVDNSGFIKLQYSIRVMKNSNTLRYNRTFQLGLPEIVSLEAAVYPTLKSLLEQAHASDSHAFLIKPADTVAAATTAGTH